jgi:hypothetical protein
MWRAIGDRLLKSWNPFTSSEYCVPLEVTLDASRTGMNMADEGAAARLGFARCEP